MEQIAFDQWTNYERWKANVQRHCEYVILKGENTGEICGDINRWCKNATHRKYRAIRFSAEFQKRFGSFKKYMKK